jgi:tetratricopeptide (TPR) repeat protein
MLGPSKAFWPGTLAPTAPPRLHFGTPMRTSSRRLRHLLPVTLLAGACLPRAQTHPRALENNEFCAQYITNDQLDRAEVHCDLGLEFSPEYADLWVNKGLIALKRNQLETAKEDFIKAIRFNNEVAQAYSSLGVVELRQRHLDRARDLFERALKVNPDFLEARYNLALSYLASREYEKARHEYKTVLLVNPNLADPHHDLGAMAMEQHQLPEAIAQFEAAVTIDPRRAMTWLSLGVAYTQAARYQDAQNAFTSCLAVDPESLPCRRAVALVTKAAASQAPVLQQAVEAEGAYVRGLRQYQKGAREAAERSFRECAAADPACRFALHQMLEEEGRAGEAAAACADFLRSAPADLYPAETAHCEQEVSRAPSVAPGGRPR